MRLLVEGFRQGCGKHAVYFDTGIPWRRLQECAFTVSMLSLEFQSTSKEAKLFP